MFVLRIGNGMLLLVQEQALDAGCSNITRCRAVGYTD